MKEFEKKYQKKEEELMQKYSDVFKAVKKKVSLKKKEYVAAFVFSHKKDVSFVLT